MCNTAGLNSQIPGKGFLLMFIEKYPKKLAGMYLQKYPDSCAHLRRDMCLHLYLHLYLNLRSELFG